MFLCTQQLRGESQEAVRYLNSCSALATAHGDTAGAIRDCMLAAAAKLMSGDAATAVVALTAQATAAQSASLSSLEVSNQYKLTVYALLAHEPIAHC
jgi:phage portal protein BeeE